MAGRGHTGAPRKLREWVGTLIAGVGRRKLGFMKRIARILTFTAMIPAISLVIPSQTRGQRQTEGRTPLTFETVSVKPSEPGAWPARQMKILPGGQTYVVRNWPAQFMIKVVYNLIDDQISGGPRPACSFRPALEIPRTRGRCVFPVSNVVTRTVTGRNTAVALKDPFSDVANRYLSSNNTPYRDRPRTFDALSKNLMAWFTANPTASFETASTLSDNDTGDTGATMDHEERNLPRGISRAHDPASRAPQGQQAPKFHRVGANRKLCAGLSEASFGPNSVLPILHGTVRIMEEAMGYEKDRMIQEEEQGWCFREGNVCDRCISDPYLRDMVRTRASELDCSFCGRSSRKTPISIPFNDVMEVIGGAVSQYFDRAVNCLGYCSAEGGYLGTTYDSWDLVHDDLIPAPSENEEVLNAVVESLGDELWCDRNPYSLTGVERYNSSWEEFCDTVKHSVRYFFGSQEVPDQYSETIPVPEMLDELRGIINEAGLISSLPARTQFFRARAHPPPDPKKASR